MDDFAHLEVVGAVVLDELFALVVADEFVEFVIGFVDGGVGAAGVVEPDGAGEEFVVAGEPDEVVMAGNDPEFVEFVPVDGVLVAGGLP